VLEQRIQREIHNGELSAALRDAESAYKEYAAKDVEWAWHFRVLEAQVLISQSDDKRTLALLNEDLPASLASSEVAVQKQVFTGKAHTFGHEYPKAERDFAEAERIARSLRPHLVCQVLLEMATLQVEEKNFQIADINFKNALAIARQEKISSYEATALGGLGWLATSQEHYDEAIYWNQAALKLSNSLGLKSTSATILGNIAWNYLELGDFENGLDFSKQAWDASERLGITGNSFYWEGTVAQSYQGLHDYGSAKEHLKKALENATKIDNKRTMAETLNYLVRLDLITKHLDEAERYNKLARQIEDEGPQDLNFLETRLLTGRIGTLRGDYTSSELHFRQVLDYAGRADSLKWEARAGLARMYDAQTSGETAGREYRKSIEMFEAARHAIEGDDLRISFLARGIESYDAYIDFLLRHDHTLDALKVADQSRSRTLAEGLKTTGASSAPSSRALDPQQLSKRIKATLLFYWLGEQRSYLWVVTPERISNFVLPSTREIDPIVNSYRETLHDGLDPLEAANANGQRLYEMLVEPAKKVIPRGSRVILFPDGSLYGLNFETLIVPGPKLHYWIEDATLTTASSLSLLASSVRARPAAKEKNIFLVGDTVSPNAEFPKLQYAASEMEQIQKYFPKADREILSGSAATPAAYLSAKPEKFTYLHFVTHGTASRTRPLESAVVLSNEGDEDTYKLYARDIVKRHLSADLVTISACNGAGTRAFSGEGLVGLSWAFLRAGAHNVIGALWEVSDDSTPQFMNTLYDGLSRGQDPASALRAAKLSMLHSDTFLRKPYYWAPFQLYAGS
jgi:CHAT domain-containing protein/Tfp pilus assembly protein PilF